MGFIIYWSKYSHVLYSFETEYISQEVLSKIKNKSITHTNLEYNLIIILLRMDFIATLLLYKIIYRSL